MCAGTNAACASSISTACARYQYSMGEASVWERRDHRFEEVQEEMNENYIQKEDWDGLRGFAVPFYRDVQKGIG